MAIWCYKLKQMEKCSIKYKLKLFFIFCPFYLFFYILPNFHPKWPPLLLPLLPMEYEIPFLPWTFLLYISDYILVFAVILMHQDKEIFQSFARMAFSVLVFCGLFFIFFPTRYPRPEYPGVDSFLVGLAMTVVGNGDTPNNCFPSLHVAIGGISVWSLRFRGPRVFGLFTFWALLIFTSTLTTKQHYLIDIIGGFAVVLVVVFLEWALFEKRFLHDRVTRFFA